MVKDAPLTTLSPALCRAIRHALGAGIPRADLAAWADGIHPTQLSQFLHGAIPVRSGDPRLIRLGAVLGVPAAECFGAEPAPSEVRA